MCSDHHEGKMASRVQKDGIGRAVPIPLTHGSADHTQLDFYKWKYVKDQVYQPPMLQCLQELRERISQATANGDGSQFPYAREKFEICVDVVRVNNGAHIERPQVNFMSIHAVLKFLYISICNRFQSTHIYHNLHHL
jgi:hypothetical protein